MKHEIYLELFMSYLLLTKSSNIFSLISIEFSVMPRQKRISRTLYLSSRNRMEKYDFSLSHTLCSVSEMSSLHFHLFIIHAFNLDLF